MASAQEYMEMMSTRQLQAILREECNGQGDLPLNAILDICEILSRRIPDAPSIDHSIRQLCRQYLGEL